jgi:hypothetical protein
MQEVKEALDRATKEVEKQRFSVEAPLYIAFLDVLTEIARAIGVPGAKEPDNDPPKASVETKTDFNA